jgi:hypothetical protein
MQNFKLYLSIILRMKTEGWQISDKIRRCPLDLEVLSAANSFDIKKYRSQNFREDSYSRWSHGPSLIFKYVF